MKRFAKIMAMLLAVAVIVVTMSSCTTNNKISSNLEEIRQGEVKELHTELAVYVDCSSSVSKAEGESLKKKAEEIAGMDGVIFPFSDSKGGEDTEISLPLKSASLRGHKRVAVLTDGENWPVSLEEELKGLDLSFMEIRIICLAKDENTEALVEGLKATNGAEYSPFQHSTVKVEYMDGNVMEVIVQQYTPPEYSDMDTLYELKCEEETTRHWSWWWLLLPLLLLPLIALLLWWLLRRRHEKEAPKEEQSNANADDTATASDAKKGSKDPGAVVSNGINDTDDTEIAEAPVRTDVTKATNSKDCGCCCCCRCCKCSKWPAISFMTFLAFMAGMVVIFLK